MEAEQDALRRAYMTAAIVGIAIMASVVVYVVVAEMMRNLPEPWKGVMYSADHPEYEYVRSGLLVLGVVVTLLTAKISAAINLSPRKLANRIPALVTHSVIVFAACDMVGVFGLILFLLAGNILDVYVFSAISLGFAIIYFPRYSRWQELIRSRFAGPTFE